MRSVLLSGGVLVAACAACVAACGGSTASPAAASKTSSGTVYVTVYGLDEVAVIDATSRAVTDHIPLAAGSGPAILLKTPDGSKLYAAGWKDNSITSIKVADKTVTPIALGSRPWVEAMSPKGDVVYAGLNSNTIAVISTANDTVVRSIDMHGLLPESIIVSPDGNTLYVALLDMNSVTGLLGGTIAAFSASTGAMTQPVIDVGSAPAWISVAPDGSKVYTLNFLSSNVSVVDTASWTVTSTISVGSGAEPIIGATTPSGSLVVTNFQAANVVVIDPTKSQVVHTLPVDGRPVGVDISADGTRGWATDFGHASLAITPDLGALTSGNLSSTIGPGPGEVVEFDPSTGAGIGDPIAVGAGATSVVFVE